MRSDAADALGKGKVAWELWRASQSGPIVLDDAVLALDAGQGRWDLSGCSLKNCRIAGAGALQIDLRGADLTDAEFIKGTAIASLLLDKASCLAGTRFADLALAGVDFSATSLAGTSFFRCVLRSIKFGGPLAGVDFGRASLTDVDFSDTDLLDCSFASANATACRFDNARLRSAPALAQPSERMVMTLEQALLRACTFLDTDFEGCSLARSVFIDCDLRRAKGLSLDDTVLRSTLLSPDAKDDWSVLQRSYSGANMVFNLIAMVIFFAPWIAQGFYWSVVNRFEIGLIDGVARLEAELAKRPAEAERLAVLAAILRTVDPKFKACVRPPQGAGRPEHAACRPVWQILIGAHEGAAALALSVLLLIYNAARLFLTWRVALLREDEKRSWQSPARSSYHWMMIPHGIVRVLMAFAILAAVLHLGPRLLAPVWIAGM